MFSDFIFADAEEMETPRREVQKMPTIRVRVSGMVRVRVTHSWLGFLGIVGSLIHGDGKSVGVSYKSSRVVSP